MASIPCVLTVLLICLSLEHMGVHGDPPTVFSSVGGSATLPCSNVVYPNCSSTTWLRGIYELFAHGKMKPNVPPHTAKRLSLLPNCSLHIADYSTEDAGTYICRQYPREGGGKHGDDAPVNLAVLQATESSTPKAHPGPPDVKPTSSSSSSSSKSSSTKTTATTASPNSGQIAPTGGGIMAGVGVCVCLLAAALITVVVIRKRRANAGGEQKHKSAQGRTTATAMQSVQPPRSSADAELHYATFQHLNPTQAGPAAKHPDDTVTYSSIMQRSGGEDQSNSRPVDPSAVYATVQKNNNAHN
ncbi:hypothetical protein ACEWY4_021869 [Coilia grayii]|uniref:Ig-like domain-containing protein n=1 Tax=Coilia grayii TaxID=363190 RepID=A0ABD1J5Y9_9TELE